MINSVATRINTLDSLTLKDVEKSLAGLFPAGRSPETGGDGGNPVQFDRYIPSEQLLAEKRLESPAAVNVKEVNAGSAGNRDGGKKMLEDIVNTLKDFFKAPSNIYIHKKLNDAAADGDLEKASKLNEKKADYNMPDPAPGKEKQITR